jgi:hypothetical protein
VVGEAAVPPHPPTPVDDADVADRPEVEGGEQVLHRRVGVVQVDDEVVVLTADAHHQVHGSTVWCRRERVIGACTPSAPAGSVLSEVSGRLPSVRFGRVALLAGALVVAACGGDGDASPDASTTTAPRESTTSSSTSTTTTSPDDAEAEVLAAYELAWQDYVRAGDPVEPDAPFLAEHRTGANLQAVRNQLSEFAAEGVVLRGEYRPGAELLDLEGASARLRDCAVDALQVVIPATGAVVQESGAVQAGAFVDMVLEDGRWKVSTYVRDEEACA